MSAIERQRMIVGEALHRARKLAPSLDRQITHMQQAIQIRHGLVHGYSVTEHETVWGFTAEAVPAIRREVEALLGD